MSCKYCTEKVPIIILDGVYPWDEKYTEQLYLDGMQLTIDTCSGIAVKNIKYCPLCGYELSRRKLNVKTHLY